MNLIWELIVCIAVLVSGGQTIPPESLTGPTPLARPPQVEMHATFEKIEAPVPTATPQPSYRPGTSTRIEQEVARVFGISRFVDADVQARAEWRVRQLLTDYGHKNIQWGDAEVIGWVATLEDPVEVMVAGWWNSAPHYAVLSDRSFTRIGCATAEGDAAGRPGHPAIYYICIVREP